MVLSFQWVSFSWGLESLNSLGLIPLPGLDMPPYNGGTDARFKQQGSANLGRGQQGNNMIYRIFEEACGIYQNWDDWDIIRNGHTIFLFSKDLENWG
jgi:hypothetical protein